MSSVSINGFGDDLSINGVRIGDLTPDDHEKIEKESARGLRSNCALIFNDKKLLFG